jgi:hypothetical protein
MPLNAKFLQRAILAFTTGLFLACSARMSAAQRPASKGARSAEGLRIQTLEAVR